MFIEPPELSSDLEWMLQSGQVGSRPLIEVLIADLYLPLAALGQFILHDPDLAQQCIAQTFVAVTLNQARYRAEFGARAWVYAIALRQFEKARRKQKGWLLGRSRVQSDLSDIQGSLEPEKSEPVLWQAFRRLNAQRQLLVYLQLINGCGMVEIGRITRRKEAAVRSELKTIQQQLGGVIKNKENREQITANRKQRAVASFEDGDPDTVEEVDHLSQAIRTCWPAPALPDTDRKVLFEQIMARVEDRGRHRRVALYRRELALGGLFIALIALLGWGASRLYADQPNPAEVVVRVTVVRTVVVILPVEDRHPTATPIPTASESAAVNQPDASSWQPSQDSVTLSFQNALAVTLPSGKQPGFNDSGPLYLAEMLRYWGLKEIKASSLLEKLQPNPDDVNVMPYELVSYVQKETPYRALMRMGGDVDMIKRLITAGFPVLIQRSRMDATRGWFGQYDLIRGFDDMSKEFLPLVLNLSDSQSTLISYADSLFEEQWQPFNYVYLVVYSPDKEADLLKVLGDQADENSNFANAAGRASTEIYSVASDIERFYAWFNRGTSLTYLDDFGGAAGAYDQAFEILANLPEKQQPWRILWYQSRPYWAYYYTGRYSDLITLANTTLREGPSSGIEESYYWRALARESTGDHNGAMVDLQASLKINPNFSVGLMQLQRLQGGG